MAPAPAAPRGGRHSKPHTLSHEADRHRRPVHRPLDRRRHQLRFGLRVDGFIERQPDRRINDIWTLLHDPDQRWYFTSDMPLGQAYAFETLSTPHSAFVLPGEAQAESLYRRLRALVDGEASQTEPESDASNGAGDPPRPLAHAITQLHRLVEEGQRAESRSNWAWRVRAKAALNRVVRKSIEMRVVALRTGRT